MSTIAESYIEKGAYIRNAEIVNNMLKNNVPLADIQKYTSLTIEEIKALASPKKNK